MTTMSGFIKEFKEFISRGNVMDMAVGVIIGGAFSAIVTSLVEDVIMPIIAIPTGGMDFTKMKLGPIMIGNLISAVINFLIIAFVLTFAYHIPGGIPLFMLTVGLGELISCMGLGQLLLQVLLPSLGRLFNPDNMQ